jgi:glycerophosphoryl diester phosphodiesterase
MSTNSWTVNKADEMQKLFELGIDAITTDEPLLLRDLLDRKEFKNK